MVRYLSLFNFTERGIREVQDSPLRAGEFRSLVEAAGGKVLHMFWLVGELDGVLIFEVPDEQTGAALLLQLGSRGFVRSHTLRAYDEQEFQQLLLAVPQ